MVGRVLHVSDDQRRVRLATRHALDPGCRVATPIDVARAMVERLAMRRTLFAVPTEALPAIRSSPSWKQSRRA